MFISLSEMAQCLKKATLTDRTTAEEVMQDNGTAPTQC